MTEDMNKTRNNADDNPATADSGPVDNSPENAASGDDAPQHDDATESNPGSTESDPMAKLQAERDQLHNQLQRTLADLQNFRKRRVQEMGDARRAATEALVAELLPVLDSFYLATDYEDASDDAAVHSMREGMLMVRTLLEGVFERHGVIEIEAAGTKFDPAVHEAVGIDPDPNAAEGVVSRVMQRGYTIEGKVLRPTRVMVGGAPRTATDEQER